jgi:hypothetical protein
MAEIKNARDIAEAKIAAVGAATEADKLRWKYTPEGEKLAAAYLKDGRDLAGELTRLPVESVPYFKKGLESILLANINLPKDEAVIARNKRAMDAIPIIKKDKAGVAKIMNQVKQIFSHYNDQGKQQRDSAYKALQTRYTAKLKQALEKRMGADSGHDLDDISVESLPQFQEEWRQTALQMDGQYLKLLTEYKRELQALG